ncbi:hypothetical protein PAXINDRAFT_100001 [Paxillus involutus ATCC 200175]|uniref:DUF6533 domain-containing protein n=1 Tax=Paxillus involutus ATCC 200175 TaxID=664439 RepID=A0A0C9U4W6_PAXIN|nr:hypothetical protein PAXINDRAFT_100001 [Paxillus involutus ATCC 200175]
MSTSELTVLARAQVVKYCRLAPAALWLFDYFLTLQDEVRVMWSSASLNAVHVLFFIVRYLPVAAVICAALDSIGPQLETESASALVYKGLGAILLVLSILSEALLLLRTLALWYDNKWVKAFLIMLYVMVSIIVVVLVALSLSLNLDSVCSTSAATSGSQQAAESVEKSVAKFSGAFISAVASFELVVLLLTIYHGISARTAGANTRGRLVNALRQGNLIYASALFTTSIANNVFFLLPISEGFAGLLDIFQVVLHCVMASRILFDLRDAGKTGLSEIFSVSNIDFASIPMRSIGEQSYLVAERPGEVEA